MLIESGENWRDAIAKIRVVEDLGIEVVAVPESWKVSAVPWMAAIAVETSKIQICSSILNVWSRTPAAMAQDYAMLEELSEGRMILGLGASGKHLVENFHGVPFEHPLRRIREYVEVFDRLIAGDSCDYDGEIFKLSGGFKVDYNRPRSKVPVYIAALAPNSISQTGAIADGIIPVHWPKDLFPLLRAQLEAGAASAGRPDKKFVLQPHMHVDVLDGTPDDAAKWRSARREIQYYTNRMGSIYADMFERNGFAEEVSRSKAAWAQRDAEGSIAAISDEMVRACQVIGTIEEVREQLKERAALVDIQMVYLPPGDSHAVGRWFEEIMG